MRKAASDRLPRVRSPQSAEREILRLVWRSAEHGWSVTWSNRFANNFTNFTFPKPRAR
jgi:hypothetical protein